MNDKPGILGKTLGQVGTLGKQIGEGVVEEAKKSAKAASQQVGIEKPVENQAEKKTGSQEQGKNVKQLPVADNKDFVRDLYAKTDNKDQSDKNSVSQTAAKTAKENPDKTPAEIQKMANLRQQLHKEKYYDPTFNPPEQEEEKPQERVERLEEEEKKKRWELQKKEEKKKPIAVTNAERKTEARVGSG